MNKVSHQAGCLLQCRWFSWPDVLAFECPMKSFELAIAWIVWARAHMRINSVKSVFSLYFTRIVTAVQQILEFLSILPNDSHFGNQDQILVILQSILGPIVRSAQHVLVVDYHVFYCASTSGCVRRQSCLPPDYAGWQSPNRADTCSSVPSES